MEGNKRVRRRRRNTVERLKNLLILLLTLSAVVLTVRVLMFNGLVDKGPRGWLDHLLSLLNPGQSVPADAPEATGQAGAAAQPVRIAVCDGLDGRGRQQPLPYCYSPPVGRGPGSGWWGLPVLS